MRSGDPLISTADERKRERIITRDEELRLLNACDDRWRRHLRPILICALDTGMRRGGILSLQWSDVDFEDRVLTIRAFNTKTMKERQVSMTTRLALDVNANIETTRCAAAALDAFSSEGLGQLAAVETVEASEMVLDATEAVI